MVSAIWQTTLWQPGLLNLAACMCRTTRAFKPFVKSFSRKAGALIGNLHAVFENPKSVNSVLDANRDLGAGLERYREAGHVAEQGLKLDPFNLDLKQASEQATQGILRDLLTGKSPQKVYVFRCRLHFH